MSTCTLECFHICREIHTFSLSCTRAQTSASTPSNLSTCHSTTESMSFPLKLSRTEKCFTNTNPLFSSFLPHSSSMASNNLKHRLTPHPDTAANDKGMIGDKRQKRKVMAKRGLKSLAIAVTLPFSLTVLSACIGSSIAGDHSLSTRSPFWFPPSWALHFTCPSISFLMGLAAWMVWAEGGFHRNPMALLFYFTQLLFAVLWDPLVFAAGATRLSLMLCLVLFVSQYGCMRVFRSVNPIAADLIKPCLAWVAFLSIVNLKLLFV